MGFNKREGSVKEGQQLRATEIRVKKKKNMQETKNKNGGNEDSKKKERHIVTWAQEVFFSFLK